MATSYLSGDPYKVFKYTIDKGIYFEKCLSDYRNYPDKEHYKTVKVWLKQNLILNGDYFITCLDSYVSELTYELLYKSKQTMEFKYQIEGILSAPPVAIMDYFEEKEKSKTE